MSFAQAASLYRHAEKSLRFLVPVEDYFRDTPVAEINAGLIRQAAIAVYPNAGPATRNRQFVAPTQAIINHAAELDLCPHIKVRRFKVDKPIRPVATREWVEAFAQACPHLPHLAALAYFMFGTAARVSEALAVTWADVDLDKRTALIRQTKVGNEREANLLPLVLAAIANIPSNRNPADRVFGYVSRDSARPSWDNAVKRAGIRKMAFHACRHGFATAMLQAGYDPVTVARMGGWKDVAIVVRTYGHAMTDATVTDAVFDTDLTQPRNRFVSSHSKQRKIAK